MMNVYTEQQSIPTDLSPRLVFWPNYTFPLKESRLFLHDIYAQYLARVYAVGISYYGRTYAEGKKIGWKDGISALRLIIRFSFFL